MSDYIAAIIVVVLVVMYFSQHKRAMKQRNLINKYLSDLSQFTVSKAYIGVDMRSSIAIDENQSKICFITNINNEITHKIIDYEDILSSEILEDGKDIVKTSRGGQVGEVNGEISSSKNSTAKVNCIALQIIIKDLNNPNRAINFMDLEGKNNNFIHKTAIERAREQARYWHSIMSVIINQTDEKDNISVQTQSVSVADEFK